VIFLAGSTGGIFAAEEIAATAAGKKVLSR